MVFLRFGLGLGIGLIVPQFVNEEVHMFLSTHFLRPHLKYKIERSRLKTE
jgi:hypothetical protein